MTGLTVVGNSGMIESAGETVSVMTHPAISTASSRVSGRYARCIDTIRFGMTGFAVLNRRVNAVIKNTPETKNQNIVATIAINRHHGMSARLSLSDSGRPISVAGIATNCQHIRAVMIRSSAAKIDNIRRRK